MEYIDSRPSNPGTSPNKLIFYKVERLIQNLLTNNKIKRNLDVNELYLANEEISDVPSLEYFSNLTRLWLQNNRIKKLDFFQDNKALSEISLQNNLIQDISYCFRNLKNIQVLFLNGNQLSNLDEVTRELSYLKYLENLNLFDNPIALEKNYRIRLVHEIPSLKCLDRNIITKQERDDARKMYEKDRIEIESRYAFLRCLDKSTQDSELGKYVNASKSNSRRLNNKSFTLTDSSSMNYNDDARNSRGSRRMAAQTVQEFSYFDWSKVKLFENRYKENEMNTLFGNDLVENKKNSMDTSKSFTNNNNNEMSQVITIRFQ